MTAVDMNLGNIELARQLVSTLPYGREGLFNPWRDVCRDDTDLNSPDIKLSRLAQHLDVSPLIILCGEAPGYQGCVRSGIAFTSERLLLDGAIPRISIPKGRLTSRALPFSEPSATIVWRCLYRLGIAERTILWNAVQLHPHKPQNPLSNRTPTDDEIALGQPGIRLLNEAFPHAKIIGVGKKASALLASMGVHVAGAVRHPANGGANEFALGLEAIFNQLSSE